MKRVSMNFNTFLDGVIILVKVMFWVGILALVSRVAYEIVKEKKK